MVVNTHVGNWVGMGFLYRSEESRRKKVDLVTALCGATDSKFSRTMLGPPFKRKQLSDTDWRILERLQQDVSEPYSTMAIALKVSARTVRRRVEKMAADGAIAAIVSTDIRAIKNDIFAYVMAEYEEPEARTIVNERLFATLVRYVWVAGLGES